MFFSEFFNCTMFSKKGEIRGYHALKNVFLYFFIALKQLQAWNEKQNTEGGSRHILQLDHIALPARCLVAGAVLLHCFLISGEMG